MKIKDILIRVYGYGRMDADSAITLEDTMPEIAQAELDIIQAVMEMLGNDIEGICEAVHKAYCKYHLENKGTEYWTKGDYDLLNEEGKEYDRRTVQAVLSEIVTRLKEGV